MSIRRGYEYYYCFSVDDEIIAKYGTWYAPVPMRVVFEFRTNFIVKGIFNDDEKLIGSEEFDAAFTLKECSLATRLKDYWMSDDEFMEFMHKALAFIDDQNFEDGKEIPIAVDMVVCTVQQEGEPFDATIDRAIKPECLYPLFLCPALKYSHPARFGRRIRNYSLLRTLRYELPTIRVVEEDGGVVVDECPICLSRPVIGSQITTIQCGHAFHYHCIPKWLAENDSCPMCRQRAHNVFVCDA